LALAERQAREECDAAVVAAREVRDKEIEAAKAAYESAGRQEDDKPPF
jgi:hypothetical protein